MIDDECVAAGALVSGLGAQYSGVMGGCAQQVVMGRQLGPQGGHYK